VAEPLIDNLGRIKVAQLKFWLSALPSPPP
jgi:hypothetical protein